MINKKLFYNKLGKGLVSLTAIVILLSSILTTTLFYEENITSNVVKENSNIETQITEISNINNLNQLNTGWYEIRNGYVFYLEYFDSYVPLYIKVRNPENLNGLLVVDEDGNIGFREEDKKFAEDAKKDEELDLNQITGDVIGLEAISGFQTAPPTLPACCPAVLVERGTNTNNEPSDFNWYYVGSGTRDYIYFETTANNQLRYWIGMYQNGKLTMKSAYNIPQNQQNIGYGFNIVSASNQIPVDTFKARGPDGEERTFYEMSNGEYFYFNYNNNANEFGTIRAYYDIGKQTLVTTETTGRYNRLEQYKTSVNYNILNPPAQTKTLATRSTPIASPSQVSSYNNIISQTYDRYPELKNYPGIIEEMITIESGWNNNAAGDGGKSIGLMQIYNPDQSTKAFGYTRNELNDPAKNIDAGAQKILSIIRDPNFAGLREQIWYGYNQQNVPSAESVRSGEPTAIYPNVDDAAAQQLVRTRGADALSASRAGIPIKLWEVQLNDGRWITISGQFRDRNDVLREYLGAVKDAKESRGAPAGANKYEVYDTEGNYIGDVYGTTPQDRQNAAQSLARLLDKEAGQVSLPSFKLIHPDTGTELIYTANSKEDAIQQFKNDYGKPPSEVIPIKPDVKAKNVVTYVIRPDGTGKVIKFDVAVDDPEDLERKLDSYKRLFPNKKLNIEKLPTLEELRQKYPNVPIEILQRELQNYVSETTAQKSAELRPPQSYEIEISGRESYYVDNERFDTKEERDKALAAKKEQFNQNLINKFAADNKKTITGERTPDGKILAKDGQGVYTFKETLNDKGIVTGGQWVPVGSSYERQRIIGKDQNLVNIIETVDTKTSKVTSTKIQTKDGSSAIVDAATLKTIERAVSSGLSLRITEGVRVDSSGQPLEITDREGNRWKKMSNNQCGDINGYCQIDKDGYIIVDDEGNTVSKSWEMLKVSVNLDSPQSIIELRDQSGNVVRRETRSLDWTPTTGTNKIENYRQVFIKDGKELRDPNEIKAFIDEGGRPTYELRNTEEWEGSKKLKYLTSYSYRTEKINEQNVRIVEAEIRNMQTGKTEGYIYGEDGKIVKFDKDGKITGESDQELRKRAEKANTQRKSRQFFSAFETILTQYRGLAYIPSLFGFNEDRLLGWRNSVDKAFAKYLGTEYWTSEICDKYIENEQSGIAYAETPQGLAQIGAHIEATRTQKIINESKEANFIYKITFNVRNGDYEKDLRAPENMTINVFIVGAGQQISEQISMKNSVTLFKKDIKLGRGKSFGRMGSNSIVKNSKNLYDRVCLTFDKIPLKWKITKRNDGKYLLCNKIIESPGTPTTLQGPAQQQGSDADLNDF